MLHVRVTNCNHDKWHHPNSCDTCHDLIGVMRSQHILSSTSHVTLLESRVWPYDVSRAVKSRDEHDCTWRASQGSPIKGNLHQRIEVHTLSLTNFRSIFRTSSFSHTYLAVGGPFWTLRPSMMLTRVLKRAWSKALIEGRFNVNDHHRLEELSKKEQFHMNDSYYFWDLEWIQKICKKLEGTSAGKKN